MAIKKVLIVGPNWVGDMVMAHALFQVLAHKAYTIDVLAPQWCLNLVKRMPEINRGIELPFQHGELKIRQRYQLAKQLRRENYDQSVVLTNSLKSALLPFFAKIPQRTSWLGEYRWGLVNDIKRLDLSQYPKMVQRFVALAYDNPNAWNKDDFPTPKLTTNKSLVANVLKKFNIEPTNQPILALSPGAAYGPAKRWPAEYYAEVARKMQQKGWQIWLFGSHADKAIGQKVQDLMDAATCINFMGKLQVDELVDLISCTNAVVSNDSGILHIAAALARPLVAIYGSTTPEYTPPLSSQAKILKLDLPCSPCFKRKCPLHHTKCLHDLKPESVLAAIADTVHTGSKAKPTMSFC